MLHTPFSASAGQQDHTTFSGVGRTAFCFFGWGQFFTYTICTAGLFGAVLVILSFPLLFSQPFPEFFHSALFRCSQGTVPPVQVGEAYRDTVCGGKGQSQRNWTVEAPAGGHSVDPKGCRQETGGWPPAPCWSSLVRAYTMGNSV